MKLFFCLDFPWGAKPLDYCRGVCSTNPCLTPQFLHLLSDFCQDKEWSLHYLTYLWCPSRGLNWDLFGQLFVHRWMKSEQSHFLGRSARQDSAPLSWQNLHPVDYVNQEVSIYLDWMLFDFQLSYRHTPGQRVSPHAMLEPFWRCGSARRESLPQESRSTVYRELPLRKWKSGSERLMPLVRTQGQDKLRLQLQKTPGL